MVCFFLCPSEPPEKVTSKGTRGIAQKSLLEKQNQPHQFALGLKDAPCAEPACCCLSFCGVPHGCTACWARKAVLEMYDGGVENFVCCQGYIGKCCCIDPRECCKGSMTGLILEGCFCPVLSLSIARVHMMAMKQIRPDPIDYQLIACSNCLQLGKCVIDIVAIFVRPLRELAHIIDLVSDCFTFSVAGCMGAQIYHEINKDNQAGEIVYVVVQGIPVVDGQDAAVGGAGLAAQDGAQTAQVVVAVQPETMERGRMNSCSESIPEHELRMSQSNASGYDRHAPGKEEAGSPAVERMSR